MNKLDISLDDFERDMKLWLTRYQPYRKRLALKQHLLDFGTKLKSDPESWNLIQQDPSEPTTWSRGGFIRVQLYWKLRLLMMVYTVYAVSVSSTYTGQSLL